MKLSHPRTLVVDDALFDDPIAVARVVEAGRATDGGEYDARMRLEHQGADAIGPIEIWRVTGDDGEPMYDLWLCWAPSAAHDPSSRYGVVFRVGSANPVAYIASARFSLCDRAPPRRCFDEAIQAAVRAAPQSELAKTPLRFDVGESWELEIYEGRCPHCGATAPFACIDAYESLTCATCDGSLGARAESPIPTVREEPR